MKYGYSLFLGELVDAINIGYNDCKDFQIICPVCKEPVFKKSKKHGEHTSHFLSHYNKTSQNQDCEFRVAQYTKETVDRYNSVSRGQSLDKFLSEIPAVINSYPFNISKHVVDRVLDFKSVKPIFHDLRARLIAHRTLIQSYIDSFADGANEHVYKSLELVKQEKMKEMTTNTIEFLLTESGEKVLNYVLVYCMLMDTGAQAKEVTNLKKLLKTEGPLSSMKINFALIACKKNTVRRGISVYQNFLHDTTVALTSILSSMIKSKLIEANFGDERKKAEDKLKELDKQMAQLKNQLH